MCTILKNSKKNPLVKAGGMAMSYFPVRLPLKYRQS